MDYKKLFGNATKFINDYTIYYNASRPEPGFSGQFLFPANDETLNAKHLMLHEPKTKNLDWIGEIFPNVEYLNIFSSRKNYKSKLENIDGINNLSKLKYLQIRDVYVPNIVVNMELIKFFELTSKDLERLINLTLTNASSEIDYYRITGFSEELNDNFTLKDSSNIKINNLSYLANIKEGQIYLSGILDENFTYIRYVDKLVDLQKTLRQ